MSFLSRQRANVPTGDPVTPTEDAVRQVLREVIDPELGMNVVDLGLVYRVELRPSLVYVEMTMTSPACPMGTMIVDDARERIGAIAPGTDVRVELVWDPPWCPELMSDDARRRLGWA